MGGAGEQQPDKSDESAAEQSHATNVIQQQPAAALYCGPQTSSRNMFWNYTRAGQTASQSCPAGSLGKASWFCEPERLRFRPSWSADFSQCRSVWLQRLAGQLEQLLEAPGKTGSAAADLVRQQHEQTMRSVLNELALMARTKELFGEDLKRIDIMIGQIIAQLRSLSVSVAGSLPAFGSAAGAPPFGSSLYEELFGKLLQLVSALFELAQRNAWLEVHPGDMRRRLELRFLGHLRESGAMLAGSLVGQQPQSWRQPNAFAAITVINGLEADQAQRLGGEPDELASYLKLHQSILRELGSQGE